MNYQEMSEQQIIDSLNEQALGFAPYNDIAHPRSGWRTFSDQTAHAVVAFFTGLQAEEAALRRRLEELEAELKSARWDNEEYKALDARKYQVSKAQTWHIARPAWLDIVNQAGYKATLEGFQRQAAERFRYSGNSLRGLAQESDRLND
jgi:predicted mannosyl-3-phosphoglycerate phosphatase (HAD superfamily)